VKRIGEDVGEKLDYTPGVFTVERPHPRLVGPRRGPVWWALMPLGASRDHTGVSGFIRRTMLLQAPIP
jgi:hypothetical protein